MTPPTLQELYATHRGKTSDKWSSYLVAYDDILAPYRHRPIRMLEIGIQNGGSMEIWPRFFENGQVFVGCDINEACRSLIYADPRVHVVVGDANRDGVEQEITSWSPEFDLVLDDGSHQSRDIVLSFARYFPKVLEGGMYVAEDLHCSYWQAFGGGLFDPASSVSFFKRLADVINHEHWGVPAARREILRSFSQAHGCHLDEEELAKIYSVEFRNSLCFIRKRAVADIGLGPRVIVGEDDAVSGHGRGIHGLTSVQLGMADEAGNAWSDVEALPEERAVQATQALAHLASDIDVKNSEIASMSREQLQMQTEFLRRRTELEEEIHQLQADLQRHRRAIEAQRSRSEGLKQRLDEATDAQASLLASKTWRIASRLQRLSHRFPGLTRTIWHAAKAARLAMRFRPAEAWLGLKRSSEARAATAKLSESGLFDEGFYLRKYPDVAGYRGGPLRHYVMLGSFEGRDPHPLFDAAWFTTSYPQVRAKRLNPLLHYAQNRHLNPNAFLDGQWYLDTNPDVKASDTSPLQHYFEHGARENRDPSTRFSTAWYRAQNPQLAETGDNPLAHYLAVGLAEGQSPSPIIQAAAKGLPVTRAEIHCLKAPTFAAEMALFVTHSPDGRIKPHVRYYLDCLKTAGIAVTLIVAADVTFETDRELSASLNGLFVRQNVGYDFAAWSHVLRLRPDLLDADMIYLLNDSLFGPFNQADLNRLLARVRESSADLIGMTANNERGWHLQTFFLALKQRVLRSVAFQNFFNQVTTLESKAEVIEAYELQFAERMRAAGLDCRALFNPTDTTNPTIYGWRELIEDGFPFVKVMVLRDRFDDVDIEGWRDTVGARGYDLGLIDALLERPATAHPLSPRASRAALSLAPFRPVSATPARPRVAFIGPWNFDNGLGVASRSYIAALRRTKFLVNLHPIKRPFHVHRQVAPALDVCDFDGDADIVLIHLNPEAWDKLLDPAQRRVVRNARLRIGLWVWETPELPASWTEQLSQIDAIWTPSQFCAEAFRSTVDNIPVQVIPHVVPLPEPALRIRPPPAVGGVDLPARFILYVFDSSSYVERKNPGALIRAFARSRLADAGWRLVLKTKHLSESSQEGCALRSLIMQTQGILLFEQNFDDAQLASLMRAASVYASPHRSEGFGLTLAEAMSLGKVVVATDYGGTRDFLDLTTGIPVPYALEKIARDHGPYRQGMHWASVDEDKLASALVRAANLSDAERKSLGEAARQRVAHDMSPEAVAGRMKEHLAQLLPGRMLAIFAQEDGR